MSKWAVLDKTPSGCITSAYFSTFQTGQDPFGTKRSNFGKLEICCGGEKDNFGDLTLKL